jgi:hypothetical protein
MTTGAIIFYNCHIGIGCYFTKMIFFGMTVLAKFIIQYGIPPFIHMRIVAGGAIQATHPVTFAL